MQAYYLHQLSFYIHVLSGSIALLLFWVAMLTRKGSTRHIQVGRYFVYGMYGIAISGFVMTTLVLLDPIGIRLPERALELNTAIEVAAQNRRFSAFLLMLSFLIFNSIRHGVLVLRYKNALPENNSFSHQVMQGIQILVALVVGWIGYQNQQLLFQIFAGICLVNAVANLYYLHKKQRKAREWIIAHLNAMMGAGIGAHTAFFVFGGRHWLDSIFSGQAQILLWILPSIIGTTAIIWLSQKYRRQYKVA